jgi:hypothetical protein
MGDVLKFDPEACRIRRLIKLERELTRMMRPASFYDADQIKAGKQPAFFAPDDDCA